MVSSLLFTSPQNWWHRINRGEGRAISGWECSGEHSARKEQGEHRRETLLDWTECAVATRRPAKSADAERVSRAGASSEFPGEGK